MWFLPVRRLDYSQFNGKSQGVFGNAENSYDFVLNVFHCTDLIHWFSSGAGIRYRWVGRLLVFG